METAIDVALIVGFIYWKLIMSITQFTKPNVISGSEPSFLKVGLELWCNLEF
jgi:hypothetical protein